MTSNEATEPIQRPDAATANPADAALIARILAGDEAAFELMMRRHNQLLFRAARAIVRSTADAEDVMQEAYLKAFRALRTFEGRSSLTTWLVRITVNEALTRAGRARRVVPLPVTGAGSDVAADDDTRASGWIGSARRAPEEATGDAELRTLLAGAVDRLPDSLRTVFMLRGVEGLSVEETAGCLELSAEAVRVRFHRARAALRDDIDRSVSEESRRLFCFGEEHCDALVARVLDRVRNQSD